MATKRKQRKLSHIRYSCITGKAVWLSHSLPYKSLWKAYTGACRHEVERVRQWGQTMSRRKANIQRLLSACTDGLSVAGELPPEKKAAARQLHLMAEHQPECYRMFYDHIQEERRRRAAHKNKCYDKQGKAT